MEGLHMKILYRAVFGLVILAVLAVGFFVPPTAHAAQVGTQQSPVLLTSTSANPGQTQIVFATPHLVLASQPRQNFVTPLCAPVGASGASPSSGVSPSYCGDIACIYIAIVGLQATGTNTFKFGVTLTNNCNVTLTQGTVKISAQVSCPASVYQASGSI